MFYLNGTIRGTVFLLYSSFHEGAYAMVWLYVLMTEAEGGFDEMRNA